MFQLAETSPHSRVGLRNNVRRRAAGASCPCIVEYCLRKKNNLQHDVLVLQLRKVKKVDVRFIL